MDLYERGNFIPGVGQASQTGWGLSFSGADILASVSVPIFTTDPANGILTYTTQPITIGTLESISVSTLRQKSPVHAFGLRKPKGHARGIRTVAGTLIFVILDREALSEVQFAVRQYLQQAHIQYNTYYGNAAVVDAVPNLLSDELPPFDITVTLMNEGGTSAVCKILGVEVVSEGLVMGINEWHLEQEMRYIAQDYEPLYPTWLNQLQSPPPRLA